MRILFITVCSFLVLGVLILMARIWGDAQNYPLYEHAFFSGPAPIVIVKADTLDKVQEAVKLKSDVAIWADVRMSRDKIPFILPSSRDIEFLKAKEEEQKANPTTPIMIGSKLSEYPWEQINEFYKNTPALKEYYEQFPQTRFVLNIVDNVHDVHSAVVEAIEGFSPKDRTLIQSDALVVMSSVKELKPEWVYGTSTPDIMRLLTFDSLYILSSTQFKGDVFIAPFTLLKRPAFNENVIVEMRRRNKRIFLGPIQTSEQFAEASRYKADGLITENLPELLQLLNQGPAQ
ncbi:hypothetical protein EZJ49_04855 [Bdellovibrio bacteriovorus]|uniref:hypothetical protein n=1 Tax=Bdellovibrio bacteriovorus TaxID=959 RepID=UPI0021CE83FF|nr:hypothetical protein [Bdellovibrio bacteriovorus]UXR65579.1 hypothetical protein EZJ49_04855 [Bdellovibrio bacteriovorus]